jgi:hypothetical protein
LDSVLTPVVGSRVSLTSVGLTFATDLQFDEWMSLMETLTRMETAFQFAIGDALIWGEARYGERYSQAMEATGLTYQALANMVWVARKVPIQNRKEGLSWTHHRVVASVEPDDQPGLLNMALEQGLSATGLQEHIHGKERKPRDIVPLPSGITADEATKVLEQYASAVRESRSGSPDPKHNPEDAVDFTCVLCASCPYKTNAIR